MRLLFGAHRARFVAVGIVEPRLLDDFSAVIENIVVRVGAPYTANAALQVGQLTEKVTVVASVQQVNATGVSILLVEQNLQKALNIAHYGYVIQTGRIVMEGAGQTLLHDERIKKAYLGL